MATGTTKKTTTGRNGGQAVRRQNTQPGRGSNHKKNKGKHRSKNQHPHLLNVLKILGLALLLSIVFVAIYMVAFVHSGPAINLDDYKSNQAQTSIIYARESETSDKYVEVGSLHGEQNRVWVDLDQIPKSVQKAFISLEDKRFYKHGGVDWIRTLKAAITLGKSGGGSTLTQQLIKNLTEENQVTVSRKLKEILYALNMERNYSKEEILEAYLNTIPLGSGCYGVETASQKYFGKDLEEVNVAEAAVLASITKAPTRYNPLLYPENNKKRQEQCLGYMLKEKAITQEQYEQSVAYKLVFTNSEDYQGGTEEESASDKKQSDINSYYVDYVIDTVISDLMKQYGYSKSEAAQKIYNGGLRIYSCQIASVQEAAEYVLEKRVTFPNEPGRTEDGADDTKKKVQAACTIMDYEGNIVAMVGGAGEKTINRGNNRAVNAVRSPGSSVKPLSVYAPAMEEGLITYSTAVQNYALTINGKQWPKNFNDSYGFPNAWVTVQYAVQESLNTCAAQVCYKLGTAVGMKYMTEKFHFTTLVKDGKYTDNNISSMAVGGMTYGVNTLEMAAAYATFGNQGTYYYPRCYTKVTDYTGEKVLLETKSKSEQALSAGVAGSMNRVMQTVVESGTGAGCGVRLKNGTVFTSYMKTGTTSDTKDKWCAGGTPYYVGAVWYGYDEQEEITNVGSSNPAARIWSAIMTRAHEGLPKKNFDYGDKVVAKQYCMLSGRLAGPNCATTATGYYSADHLPDECDGTHTNPIHNSQSEPTVTTESQTETEPAPSSAATTSSTSHSATEPPVVEE